MLTNEQSGGNPDASFGITKPCVAHLVAHNIRRLDNFVRAKAGWGSRAYHQASATCFCLCPSWMGWKRSASVAQLSSAYGLPCYPSVHPWPFTSPLSGIHTSVDGCSGREPGPSSFDPGARSAWAVSRWQMSGRVFLSSLALSITSHA